MKTLFCVEIHNTIVDFIVNDNIAIEVKSTDNVQSKHLRSLKKLQEEKLCKQYYLVCCDPVSRVEDRIYIIHWEVFLKKMWNHEIVS